MTKHIFGTFLLGLVLAAQSSCTVADMKNRSMPTAGDGEAFFIANCSSCHGKDAKGSGPAAGGLQGVPPDLTMLSIDNGGDFPAADALSYIYGDPEGGHLVRVMPEFGDIMADDLVPVEIDGILTPTPRELAGLLAYLESIQN